MEEPEAELGSLALCMICREDVHEDDFDEHVNGIQHMSQYGEYLRKYSQLMHVSSTLHPNVRMCEQRLCIAYDMIIETPGTARAELWETCFRYALGQRTYSEILRRIVNGPDEPPAEEASSRTAQCVCCWSNARTTLLRPCKHVVACRSCADRLSECPICRQPISEIEDVFC